MALPQEMSLQRRTKSLEMLAAAGAGHSSVSAEHNPILANPRGVPETVAEEEDPPPEGLGPVYLSVFIDVAGMAMCIPVLPYFIIGLPGGSPTSLGLVTSVYSAAAVVGTAMFGCLSDVIGRRPTILISIFGSGVGFVGTSFATDMTTLIVWRCVAGLFGGSIPVSQAYIADVTTDKQRAKYFGYIGATIGIAFTFGPAVGALLSSIPGSTPQWVLRGAGFFSFVAFVQALVRLKEPERKAAESSQQSSSVCDLLKNSYPLLVFFFASFCNNYNFQVMQTLYSLVIQDFFGYGSLQLGMVLFGAGITLGTVQGVVIGPLVKRWGELGAGTFACLLLIVTGLIWPMLNTLAVFWIHMPVFYLYVMGSAISNTAIPALQASFSHPSMRGVILGLGQSVAALSRVASPLVSGSLYEISMKISEDLGGIRGPPFIGFGQLPFFVGACASFLAMLALFTLRSKEAPPQEGLAKQEMTNVGDVAEGA